MDVQFSTIEKDHPDVLEFRHSVVCVDGGLDKSALSSQLGNSEFRAKYVSPDIEDCFKFSEGKWQRTEFDELLVAYVDKKIVSLSGTKIYSGSFLRAGMHYYTLKPYRKTLRFPLWRSDGFMEMAIRRNPSAACAFLTVYAHNSRLKALAKKMRSGNFGHLSQTEPSATRMMQNFRVAPELVIFPDVPQIVFYYPMKADFSVEALVSSLSGSSR